MASTFIWKDILHPGTQHARTGERFTFTRKDTVAAKRNLLTMLSRGLRVPCCWEHQSTADPIQLSQDQRINDQKAAYAKHVFGELRGAKVDANGVLWARHEVYDPTDVEQLRRTKYVSPKVYPSYFDQLGNSYRGSTIGHVAATPTPVQSWQRPFELSRDAVYLSYSPEGDDVAKEKDDAGDDKDTKPKDGPPESKREDGLDALIEALKGVGLMIPDEVTDIPGLIIAVKAGGGADDDDLDNDADLDADPAAGTDAPTTGAGGPPMLMSTAQAEPFIRTTKTDMEQRIGQLFRSGRLDRVTALRMRQEVKSVQLSVTRAGVVQPNSLLSRIEAYEALPKGCVWSRNSKGNRELSTVAIGAPTTLTGDPVHGTKEATDLILGMIPDPPARK